MQYFDTEELIKETRRWGLRVWLMLLGCWVLLVSNWWLAKRMTQALDRIAAQTAPVERETKVMVVGRDDYEDMGDAMAFLAKRGWRLAGTLCNDGINGRILLFERPKAQGGAQ